MRPFRLLLLLLPAAGLAQIREWRIDSAHSGAHFSVRHMMVSYVRGQLGKINGAIKYDPADARTATVEARIDVAGIDTREPKRDAHLRSPDFFDVEKFPAITFRSKRVEPASAGGWRVIGDLTIRDVTREVTLQVDGPTPPIKDPRVGLRAGATATTSINRKDFGITWNRVIEAGGVSVADTVNVTIDLEFVEAKPAPATSN
jgi:polyisoprenoid-binding protein YceI